MPKRKAEEMKKLNPADYLGDESPPDSEDYSGDEDHFEITGKRRRTTTENQNVDNSDLVSIHSSNSEKSVVSRMSTNSLNSTSFANAYLNQNIPDIRKLQEMPLEEFHEMLSDRLKKWKVNTQERVGFWDLINIAKENFNIENGIHHRSDIERGYDTAIIECVALGRYIVCHELEDEIHPEYELSYNIVINKIAEVIHNVFRALNHLYSAEKATSSEYDFSMNDDNYIFKFIPSYYGELTEIQELLLYIENCLVEDDLRKYGDDVYRKHYNGDGHFTHYWEKYCSLKEYIHRKTRKEYNQWAWKKKVSKNNVETIMKVLLEGNESELPELKRDRHAYSFTNGVYMTIQTEDKLEDYFHYYDNEYPLSTQIASCKKFDVPFDNDRYEEEMIICEENKDSMYAKAVLGYEGDLKPNWYMIKTPYLQSVLEFQFNDNSEMHAIIIWFYILIGRLLYGNAELDNWQVMPILQGVAGTGKSLIIHYVIKLFYEVTDIGIMNNNVDKKFGVEAFVNKFIWLGLDIDKKWEMDKTTLQSMISAEDVAVNRKYQNPLNVWKWNVPGILATNEDIGFADSGGSISRRLIAFIFKKKVPESKKDPELGNKLILEIAEIIKKCNLAYLWAVKRYAKQSIHSVMPNYFVAGKEKMQIETDPIYDFLSGLDLRFSDEEHNRWIPVRVLEQKYKDWCQENGQLRTIDFGKYAVLSALATLGEKNGVQIDYISRTDDPSIKSKEYPRDENAVARRHKNHRSIIQGMDLAENSAFEEKEPEVEQDVEN